MSVIHVTKESHPTLYEALDLISYDCGAGSGHTFYEIPDTYSTVCDIVEPVLATLSQSELEALAIGEETDMKRIAERSMSLSAAADLFNSFFNGFVGG